MAPSVYMSCARKRSRLYVELVAGFAAGVAALVWEPVLREDAVVSEGRSTTSRPKGRLHGDRGRPSVRDGGRHHNR